MINVSIFGSTGYVGGELLRLLLSHPNANIRYVTSATHNGQSYSSVFENFRHVNIECIDVSLEKAAEDSDIVFLAMPHAIASKTVTADILKKTKIIDLGADFRLKDVAQYEEWYSEKHGSKELLDQAVYGLCEINREKIKASPLIANPGCYTTCSILSLYPLLKEKLIEKNGIIIDAKSGVSGAGRGIGLGLHFSETDESVKAYKIASHRHTPEIEEQLSYAFGESINLVFTPHLIPMNRGILTTSYAKVSEGLTYADIKKVYEKYYSEQYFIRLTKQGVFPETRWVKGSNFCDIGITLDKRTNTIICIGTLDNLIKGAAGQAVQNMNIMFGIDEKTAIDNVPVFPA